MVSFSRLAAQAKKAVDAAGGPEALKQKAQKAIDDAGGTDVIKAKATEVRDIAKGEGSLSDKAKAAGDVVKRDPDAVADTQDEAAPQRRPAGEADGNRS